MIVNQTLTKNNSNLDDLSKTLRRMRGVALKLGQFLSMQDERSQIAKELSDALESARMHADIMPEYQLIEQLTKS